MNIILYSCHNVVKQVAVFYKFCESLKDYPFILRQSSYINAGEIEVKLNFIILLGCPPIQRVINRSSVYEV